MSAKPNPDTSSLREAMQLAQRKAALEPASPADRMPPLEAIHPSPFQARRYFDPAVLLTFPGAPDAGGVRAGARGAAAARGAAGASRSPPA
ncbi:MULTISPECIES: hypothetical protein [unclassified Meiothermus]|uniref:hypothetical protein n=1 Tax=unclassified Meiothermus TaxID=370471 RepID=UPI000D7BDA75|nr:MULTISPECIES: hypothetical protein [unclassified Meiothermus]PZA05939.1 hypothetical protein DNA98_15730 [Meiothermus sp. Pnk-1]RYM36457.1 hypothetical protein EWH23_09565 [Meiothermus sp. PNK-Is4]